METHGKNLEIQDMYSFLLLSLIAVGKENRADNPGKPFLCAAHKVPRKLPYRGEVLGDKTFGK